MKSFFIKTGVFLIILLFTVAVLTQLEYAPCGKPLPYSIGDIDARFNKSKGELENDIREASGIWGEYDGKELFAPDPDAELTINLVYDERQRLINELSELDNTLKSEKESMSPQEQQYKNSVKEFETRLKNFNDRVSYWNSQGGAPSEEFESLKKEQKELEAEASRLNDLARTLNQSTKEYNTHVGQFNQTLNVYENTLDLKPEQGLYDGETKKIDIYFVNNRNELIHTLAHELGHALKIEHVNDKDAIMFPYSSQVISLSLLDEAEKNRVCKKHSYLDIAITRWVKSYYILKDLIASRFT